MRQKTVKLEVDTFFSLVRVVNSLSLLDVSFVMSSEELKEIFFEAEQLHPVLEDKLEKLTARSLFTAYRKSHGAQREEYREKYLDFVGIPEDYRTDEDFSPWADSERQAEEEAEQEEFDRMLVEDDPLPEYADEPPPLFL